MQRALQRVEDLGSHAQAVPERARADRDDHELLEVDLVVGVRAAVEHVHHRHRQHVGRLAAEVAPQRQTAPRRRPPWRRRARCRGWRWRRAGPCCRCRRSRSARGRGPPGRPGRCRPPPRRARRSRSPRPCRRPCRPTPRRRRAARPPRTRPSTRPTARPRARRRPTSAARRPRRSGCRGCPGSAARALSRSRSSLLHLFSEPVRGPPAGRAPDPRLPLQLPARRRAGARRCRRARPHAAARRSRRASGSSSRRGSRGASPGSRRRARRRARPRA